MHQLELFADAAKSGAHVGLRVNPPLDGAGHNNRTSTGGVASSFGLWHEYLEDALEFTKAKRIVVDRLHIHIGSGTDPISVWSRAIDSAFNIVKRMPDITVLDIGGGYKIARTNCEHEADMQEIPRFLQNGCKLLLTKPAAR